MCNRTLTRTICLCPYYVETSTVDDNGNKFVSRSQPLGLVEDVDIVDSGLLHSLDDEVTLNGTGNTDPRDPILGLSSLTILYSYLERKLW